MSNRRKFTLLCAVATLLTGPAAAATTISLTDVGGVPGGEALNTEAFARGMERVSASGGGVLKVPDGVWLTGPIVFKSDVELHLDDEALVVFTPDRKQYPIVVNDLAGEHDVHCTSPLTGTGLRNVKITGHGVFDGSGDSWRPQKKDKLKPRQWEKFVKTHPGFVTPDGKQWYPSEMAWRGEVEARELMKQDKWDIALYEQYRDFLRPKMVRFIACSNLTISGVTFANSPMWTVNPVLCTNVVIKGIQVRNPEWGQNTDSVDIESCNGVRVSRCEFSGGDDGICLKSGQQTLGYRVGVPCENIKVEHCKVYSGHGGFVIGSEMSGGVRNVEVKGCTFIGTETGLRFKTQRGRGGVVENIKISNIVMRDIIGDALTMTMSYDGRSVIEKQADGTKVSDESAAFPVDEGTPIFRDIKIRDVTCLGCNSVGTMTALPEMPLRGFSLRDAVFKNAKKDLTVTYFEDPVLEYVLR